jgi:VIT1/CCC1 family predicted Fe2+/Mn2+ transporter
MNDYNFIVEILKVIIPFINTILVIVLGLFISKKIEMAKLSALKEKEWQVKWADIFLKHATDFNDNISVVIYSLFSMQKAQDNKKKEELLSKIYLGTSRLSELDWNIRNYTQFSKYGKDVLNEQEHLMKLIENLISKKEGSLEEVREKQFIYNSAVRKVHGDILNSK